MELPNNGTLNAFVMIVDINSFTPMVSKASPSENIAQFVRDVLSGGIDLIEKHGGSVVSFMGDAFLAIMDNPDSVYAACGGIAKDLDRRCEYISNHQEEYPDDWHYAKGGPSLKISIEYGWIDISTIYSGMLGEQRLFIGPAINYASRISSGGEGNRCVVGPEAYNKHGMNQWMNSGPYTIKGKNNEGEYHFWELDLGDVWRAGRIAPGDEKYWG